MSYVIRCLGLAADMRQGPIGQYLEKYDPEAHDGGGQADFTTDPEKAVKFESAVEAFALWKSVPETRPTRPDGKPNKPLTTFTIEVLSLDDAMEEEGRKK